MGEVKDREEEKKPDRLAEVIVKKIESVTIEDRKLEIRKWNLHTSLEQMGRLGDILKELVSSVGPKMDIGSLLQRDIGALLLDHEENIIKILVGSIVPGNFKDAEEAKTWITELGVGEVLQLFAIIAKQNIRPLVKAVGEIAKEVGVKIKTRSNADQKESQPQTS